MKPPKFQFARATSIDDVVRYLDADESAKVIAGGQSLVALMNFRLATPSLLVDISRVDDLGRIEVTDTHVVIGATVRQRTAETSDDVRAHCALIPQALNHVGHVQIRNRGTVVGSIVHADPASELPAVALALGADLLVSGPGGSRVIAARDFFVAPYWTTLEHGESGSRRTLPGRSRLWRNTPDGLVTSPLPVLPSARQVGRSPWRRSVSAQRQYG